MIAPYTHIDGERAGAQVGEGARVGPFARLRPGANLGPDVHVGNFVEVKNTTMAAGAKANHLAYLGDSIVGEDAKGQFCEVKFTVKNGGSKEITVTSSDLTGYIGSNEYGVDTSTISTFGGDYFSTSINPGLAADCDVFIDIPAGQALDYIKFKPAFSFADGVTVSAK